MFNSSFLIIFFTENVQNYIQKSFPTWYIAGGNIILRENIASPLVLLNYLFLFFIHFKLELQTKFTAKNYEKCWLWMIIIDILFGFETLLKPYKVNQDLG